MNTTTPGIRDFARRLVALEAARDEPRVAGGSEAVRVCEKLRLPLARLAGVAGFHSLLSRALALAKSEVVSLNPVQVRQDGSLEGFDGAGDCPGAGPEADGGAAVVAHLLGLLVTFIGEPLTRQLVRDAWPDAATDETDGQAGGRP
jgi:hypothetical protein